MFIHIGGDIFIKIKDVIAILDMNHLGHNINKEEYFQTLEKSHQVVKITMENIKSIIFTTDILYYSPISSLTLKRRADLSN